MSVPWQWLTLLRDCSQCVLACPAASMTTFIVSLSVRRYPFMYLGCMPRSLSISSISLVTPITITKLTPRPNRDQKREGGNGSTGTVCGHLVGTCDPCPQTKEQLAKSCEKLARQSPPSP